MGRAFAVDPRYRGLSADEAARRALNNGCLVTGGSTIRASRP
jgi:hypothetical protein